MEVNSTEALRFTWDARVDSYAATLADPNGRAIAAEVELAAFKREMPPGAALDILDAGCGVGFHGRKLLAGGHRVTFLDVSPAMLARAKGLVGSARGASFKRLDVRHLDGIEDSSFDAIVAGGTVISDCGNPGQALSELTRTLRTAGIIGFSVRNLDGPQQEGAREPVIRGGGPGFDWWFFSCESVAEACSRAHVTCRRLYPVLLAPPPGGRPSEAVKHHLDAGPPEQWRRAAWEMFVIAEKEQPTSPCRRRRSSAAPDG